MTETLPRVMSTMGSDMTASRVAALLNTSRQPPLQVGRDQPTPMAQPIPKTHQVYTRAVSLTEILIWRGATKIGPVSRWCCFCDHLLGGYACHTGWSIQRARIELNVSVHLRTVTFWAFDCLLGAVQNTEGMKYLSPLQLVASDLWVQHHQSPYEAHDHDCHGSQKFNSNYFGLPPSFMHRMTRQGGNFMWTMMYVHSPNHSFMS